MTPNPDVRDDIRDVLFREWQKEARSFQKLKGGRNSQVFRVDCADGSVFAVKAYFQSAHDPRDRLGCEFRALQFLKGQGLRDIATPLAADPSRGIAVYEFVAGRAVVSGDIGEPEIDRAIEFLRALKAVADSGKAEHFPPAAEASFSIDTILQNLDQRFRRLAGASESQPVLAEWLSSELAPARKLAERRCLDLCRDFGIATEGEISMPERTLSPSDFGFHNALRGEDGGLVFLDFEYFGWDDPAKTIADFLLHPGMQLSAALKQRFFSGVTAAFAAVPKLRHRARAVYPLYALKWCAILLNEFTLEHRARRCFADGANGGGDETAQLTKARSMLARVTNDEHDFPRLG
jgi:Phosphotransferase enzyme family